ncbi:MAG: CAP domain-containing protein [Verrucomicrobia bacterium]|nr:MAG: CAP domain-containing protein [Verrucomicrobiota bacterium]
MRYLRLAMKITPIFKNLALTISLLAFFASCSATQNTRILKVAGGENPNYPQSPSNKASSELLQTVNQFRADNGIAPLQRHAGLERLAWQHSEYLRQNRGKFSLYGKNVSHFGSESRHLFARERYRMENISENVAWSPGAASNSALRVLQLWKNSKDHLYNLKSNWTHTGIAVVIDSDGSAFATMLVATVSQSQMLMRERLSGF